jgi:flavin-dependent dehydrogenase
MAKSGYFGVFVIKKEKCMAFEHILFVKTHGLWYNYFSKSSFQKRRLVMSKIIVAGGGHGGIVAAIKLAEKGYDVSLFEKNEKGASGLQQTDALDMSALEFAEIPVADYFRRGRNEITFVPSDSASGSLTLPQQDEISLLVDRIELVEYLLGLAEGAGVKVHYGESVLEPMLLGNRVCGIKTDKGEYYADLVIDACGVNSPVRCNLPQYLGIDRPIEKYDVIYSYRGYFNRVPDTKEPKTDYNIYFKDDGNVGFSWLITEFDRVDALVCRFTRPEESEILQALNTLHSENEHMGLDLVYGGSHGVIPVCQPLAVLVADGYAAVGDSAFMTVALKGSGLAYSIKAGKLLADAVVSDINGCYSQETLWEYQKNFFKEIGFGACTFAVLKNMLPFMTAEDVNKLFKMKLITTEELSALWGIKTDLILNKKSLPSIKEKIRLVRDEPMLKELFASLAVWLTKYAVLQTSFPTKYDKKDVLDWADKYNKFFDSIKKKD